MTFNIGQTQPVKPVYVEIVSVAAAGNTVQNFTPVSTLKWLIRHVHVVLTCGVGAANRYIQVYWTDSVTQTTCLLCYSAAAITASQVASLDIGEILTGQTTNGTAGGVIDGQYAFPGGPNANNNNAYVAITQPLVVYGGHNSLVFAIIGGLAADTFQVFMEGEAQPYP